jgi:hypothetical protein
VLIPACILFFLVIAGELQEFFFFFGSRLRVLDVSTGQTIVYVINRKRLLFDSNNDAGSSLSRQTESITGGINSRGCLRYWEVAANVLIALDAY